MAENEPERVVRWAELPKRIQFALERTPPSLWNRIRPFFVESPETHRILDLARLMDQILPRSTRALQRRMASKEDRARKREEILQSMDALWSAVDDLEAALERIARAAGIWTFILEYRKRQEPKKVSEPAPAGKTSAA